MQSKNSIFNPTVDIDFNIKEVSQVIALEIDNAVGTDSADNEAKFGGFDTKAGGASNSRSKYCCWSIRNQRNLFN